MFFRDNFILGCDVDITVAPSDRWWLHWLESVTGAKISIPKDNLNYDLTVYFKDELNYEGLTGFEFWKQEGLYDGDYTSPVEGSVDALKQLVEEGATLVFISHEMGLHGRSKREWIKRHFPFATTTVLTENNKGFNSKSLIDVDCMIEDRHDGLQGFTFGSCNGVIMDSPYREPKPKPIAIEHKVVSDWQECYTYVSSLIEEN